MDPLEFKRAFWDKVGPFDQILPLLNSLHDTAFFFKDLQSRHTMNNERAVASARVATEADTLGKIGYEFWYPERIAIFLKQDQEVMQTGVPIINALCPTPDKGSDSAIMFSKIPLRDQSGEVIGLAGVWREVDSVKALPPSYSRFSAVLDEMHQNFAEALTIEVLAQKVGLSRSQFSRSFRKFFGLSPYDYLKSLRINAAAQMLRETNLKTTDVALQSGFYDHSHFSKTFKEIMGVPPREYRKRHGF
ncbi:helix-turn-helix domain-containing protein [Coraliomargarita akajimensis]|uniref:Transcriptional regulator, AraC family n=1 Tax=Coraliomargarita akajimensis (strain DSM 45221 / IAM 15411 / JCM 23193 / KCTC 12865 / 04OKA010-24) TaxID=583355 RepID=D5EP02_CORAD|nr:helix-turn-helix domain-containing protein [Coraliomargarita akajimensis]ADE53661.1 transcriptional regulator, AraC family [Coraliomargarita akajimensis DSM 45221]